VLLSLYISITFCCEAIFQRMNPNGSVQQGQVCQFSSTFWLKQILKNHTLWAPQCKQGWLSIGWWNNWVYYFGSSGASAVSSPPSASSALASASPSSAAAGSASPSPSASAAASSSAGASASPSAPSSGQLN